MAWNCCHPIKVDIVLRFKNIEKGNEKYERYLKRRFIIEP